MLYIKSFFKTTLQHCVRVNIYTENEPSSFTSFWGGTTSSVASRLQGDPQLVSALANHHAKRPPCQRLSWDTGNNSPRPRGPGRGKWSMTRVSSRIN
jgi:hypothetical protein